MDLPDVIELIEAVKPQVPVEGQVAPTIKLQSEEVTVAEGQPIKLKVTYSGKPAPKINFYHEDETTPLTASRRLKIEETPTEVTLTIPKAELSDGGKYTVKALNEQGKGIPIYNNA